MNKSPPNDAARATGLADALFTKVQQRVLGLLFVHPDRSFYANEVIALANMGTGAVQRELARLQAVGLVTVKRIGRQKHYQANPESPVFHELRGLVLKTVGLADVLSAALEPLKDRISQAFVFGSVAKGQDSAASDIDLMVISDELSYAELFAALEPATEQLDRPINPTVYSRAELGKRLQDHNAFACRVLQGEKIWLIGGEDELQAR
ncbi:nucleotidyltransferase domain-containing protein [Wenzhouxiangella marina]|uniref:nucleotidyltransferase domain-containing protein n=1 Tax=Wenzhouxiangella marina TaxID=1579979 RepID=UPI00185DEBB2|nr:nucleotidyltransferase domain-containing protein [Wenzhouxiangella marina]MBB6086854.1 putative nucleotidyltransferase [Wenzhouxiangella marina]